MKRIFIPRSVAETSMPFVVDGAIEYFGADIQVFIITRPENTAIMAAIMNVQGVYSVDTKFFSEKTIINDLDYINNEDIVLMPITNIKVLSSYLNVIKFIKSKFKTNSIYFHDFDNLKISKYSEIGLLKNLVNKIYLFLSFIGAIFFSFIYSIIAIFFNNL